MNAPKQILVCPMDWGLGHATRVVPIIRMLRQSGVQVVLGADNMPLHFLRQQFPDAPWVKIPGFKPEYQKKGSLSIKMAAAIPQMMKEAVRAHDLLEKIILEHHIDAVISDNRYELWSAKVPTVFMTHQLNILLPGIFSTGRPVIRKMINSFIIKHDELWIPDFANLPNLSGKLSHLKKMPLADSFFIGPLSRFEGAESLHPGQKEDVDVLCLLSGPEPQRSIFEKILIKQLENSSLKSVTLLGKPDRAEKKISGNMEILSHADDKEILALLQRAKTVICRSGYSSLMDMVSIGKKHVILVPTPGQPEQEYLAKKLKDQSIYYSCSQKEFSLTQSLEESKKYSGMQLSNDYQLLKNRIASLLDKIRKTSMGWKSIGLGNK